MTLREQEARRSGLFHSKDALGVAAAVPSRRTTGVEGRDDGFVALMAADKRGWWSRVGLLDTMTGGFGTGSHPPAAYARAAQITGTGQLLL